MDMGHGYRYASTDGMIENAYLGQIQVGDGRIAQKIIDALYTISGSPLSCAGLDSFYVPTPTLERYFSASRLTINEDSFWA